MLRPPSSGRITGRCRPRSELTADKNFALLKDNPRHPSLHFKKVGTLWSARVGEQYRALGKDVGGEYLTNHGVFAAFQE